MASAAVAMPSTIPTDREAEMEYIRPDSKMNRRYMSAGREVSTGKYETKKVSVHDIRPEREKYTLQTTGFQLFDHKSHVKDWSDMNELNSTYAVEVKDLVKRVTGASEVLVFAPVRRTTHEKTDVNKMDSSWNDQPPASDVHVDYTPKRAKCLAKAFAEENDLDINAFSKYTFINLWRAVSDGPQNWPLALCRGDSVEDEEGVVNHLLYVDVIPDLENLPASLSFDPMYPEGSLFTHRPQHYWTYYNNMTKDEVMMFTLYDSLQQRPWRVPHCAFRDSDPDTKPRESVEIRTLCFFE